MIPVQIVWNLVVQQLAMRYRRAWLGLAWMVLVPLATMSIMGLALSLVFVVERTRVIGNIVVCLLPYGLFQATVSSASGSIVGNQDILRRHNVNRMVFPLSAAAISVVEYLIGSLSLLVLAPLLGMHWGWSLMTLPLGFVCLCALATGLGLLGAIGTVYFRDLSHLIQVTLSLLYWVTPIVYTLEMIPPAYRKYFYANPLVSMLAMYTEPLIHGRFPPLGCLVAGPVVAAAALALGVWVFQRRARQVVFYL